jgi:hypothetical protein
VMTVATYALRSVRRIETDLPDYQV